MPMKISNIKEELITDFREDTAIAKLRQSAAKTQFSPAVIQNEKKSNSHVNSASSSSPIIFNSAQNSSKLISCGILMQSKIRPANGLSQTLQHVNKATGTKSKPRSIGFEYPKPAYSYSCLNAIALKNSRSGCLPVSEIYSFMCEHFPYFKTAPISWKNCVRHNLSLTDYFEKNPSARHQRRFLWSIKPNKISEVDEVVQKWSRKNHWAIRKAMVYPENLEALERGEMKHGSTEDSDNENDMESESDMKDSISEPCSDNELDDMDIEELQEYEEDSEEEEVDVEDSSGPILDHYISDSMQEMLDIDIKAEVATVVGGTNEFSSLINNLPSLDIESSYTDVCGDISWLGAPKWSSNDLYADVGACVNPNSVTPIISSSFLNASKAHLNLNTTYYRRSNSPPPSPKENKSHLTFSPHQIKVSSVQEPKRSSLLAVSNKPLVDAIKKELITDFKEDNAVAKNLPSANTIKLAPGIGGLTFANSVAYTKLKQSAVKTQVSPTVFTNVVIQNEKESNSHVNASSVSSASSSSPIIFNSAQNSSKLVSRGILMQSKSLPANGLSQTLQHVNTASGTKSKPKSIGFEYPKPAYSYSCLIAMALKNSRSGSLPVSEIYSFMCEHFPYFKTAPSAWKNSVRHNLSLNKCFEKIEKPATNGGQRKGCLWAMNPNKISKMDEEVQKWSRKNPMAIRKAMVYPENLEALERGEMKHGSTGDSDGENDMQSDTKDNSISEQDNELDDTILDIKEELQEYEEDSDDGEKEFDVEVSDLYDSVEVENRKDKISMTIQRSDVLEFTENDYIPPKRARLDINYSIGPAGAFGHQLQQQQQQQHQPTQSHSRRKMQLVNRII